MRYQHPTGDAWKVDTELAWQSWIAAVSDTLNAVLTRSADTGQINRAAYPTRPAINNYAGYEVFAFTDTLQATKPVFIKVEYGLGGTTTLPTLRYTIGTGTDGAGTMTGRSYQSVQGLSGGGGATFSLFSAAEDGYAMFLGGVDPLNTSSDSNQITYFVIERTRDFDGTPNGDGIAWWMRSSSNRVENSTVLTYDGVGGGDPTPTFDLRAGIPNPLGPKSALKGDTAYAFPIAPHTGWPHAPSQAILACWATDFPRLQEVVLPHYGVSMTFLSLGTALSSSTVYLGSTGVALAITGVSALFRWEA